MITKKEITILKLKIIPKYQLIKKIILIDKKRKKNISYREKKLKKKSSKEKKEMSQTIEKERDSIFLKRIPEEKNLYMKVKNYLN